MSTEGFFDHVARTLAEPMPRRRAVRVIGASLVTLAVPVAPRIAQAATIGASDDIGPTVCPGKTRCSTYIDPSNWPKGQKHKCCPFPAQQWRCGGSDGWTCVDGCAAIKKTLGLAKGKRTKPTWSVERMGGDNPDWKDRPKRYDCCILPDTIPSDGKCLPNCAYQYRFGGGVLGPIPCGETCCATYQVCENGTCRKCEDVGEQSCQPAKRGAAICCKKGTNCCFNNTSTACCGPKQTCKTGKGATCVCEDGTKCGTDCCKKGEICAGSECCTADRLCPTGHTANTCCSGENEYCFFKADPDNLAPLGGTKLRALGICKEGCAPRNRAGRQCCGTGLKPNRRRTRCVPE